MRIPLAAGLLLLVGCRSVFGIDDVGGSADASDPGDTTVGFATTSSLVDETFGAVSVPLVLGAETRERVTVRYRFVDDTAQLGTDFDAADGTLVIEPGGGQGAITFRVADDETDEPDETFSIELLGADGATLATSEHTVTIAATPLPRVRFTEPASMLVESTALRIGIVLDRPVAQTVTVEVAVTSTATPDRDYTRPIGEIEISPTTSSAEIQFQTLPDALDEDDEQITLTLANVDGALLDAANSTHVHTIVDDDPLPTVSFVDSNMTVVEGTTVMAGLRLSAPSGREVRVDIVPIDDTAMFGADYTFPTPPPVIFAAGQMMMPFPIQIVADNMAENEEDARLMLGAITNGMPGGVASNLLLQIR